MLWRGRRYMSSVDCGRFTSQHSLLARVGSVLIVLWLQGGVLRLTRAPPGDLMPAPLRLWPDARQCFCVHAILFQT